MKERMRDFFDKFLGAASLSALLYFLYDWKSFAENAPDNWLQWLLIWWAISALCLYDPKRDPEKPKQVVQKILFALVVTAAFAFITVGKGCSTGSADYDCRPAGPGIYNDC